MNPLRIILVLLTVAAGIQVFADVAPPPGYSAVGNALELRSKDGLDGYRLFLKDAGGTVEEIVFGSSGTKTIDASGRGGASRYATLWAVPSGSVPEGELSPEDLDRLGVDLEKEGVAGQIELLSHEFRTEVSVIESGGEHREVFEIAMDPATGKPSAKQDAQASGSQAGLSYVLIAIAAGGLLIFAAMVLAGLILFRRSRKRKVV